MDLPQEKKDELRAENAQYGDLALLPELLDSYSLLTMKVLRAFDFVVAAIPKFDFLMKVKEIDVRCADVLFLHPPTIFFYHQKQMLNPVPFAGG